MISLNGFTIKPTRFPDGTSQVWHLPRKLLQEIDHLRLVCEVVWQFENEGEFMVLAQLVALLGERERTLYLPYVPYARQDKAVSNDSTFALRPFTILLNTLCFSSVRMLDPHSYESVLLIRNARPVYPTEAVKDALTLCYANLVVYPDHGAEEKYATLWTELPYAVGQKVRDPESGVITEYSLVGDVAGKNVLIIDDICDGGATFVLLTKALLSAGADTVCLFVTHGIFSKGTKVLFDAGISRIITIEGEIV